MKTELTQEQKAAQAARMKAYAEARDLWAWRDPERISPWEQTVMYVALTKLWHAMTAEEQKFAGADACIRYH